MSGTTLTLGGRRPPPNPDSGRALRLTLDAWPLTPIHVGDGSRLAPESYLLKEEKLKEEKLCRFEPARVVAGMTAAERRNYLGALDRGDLPGAQGLLRRAVQDSAIVERIAASGASLSELHKAIENPDRRRGEVRPFIRTGGRPFIPGSSIKGALRTALASHWLPKTGLAERPSHDEAMKAALGLATEHDTDSDPLRFLSVADVMLPEGATLIDQPQLINANPRPGKEQKGPQIHAERTRCYTEPDPALSFSISIIIRPPTKPGIRMIRKDELLAAANRFHWDIWLKERSRFFSRMSETCEAMDEALKRVPVRQGTSNMAREGPGVTANFMLLRLGRWGHFESKSLTGIRQGVVPQHNTTTTFGSTRTVVSVKRKNGNTALLPMGWLLTRVVASKETGA